MTIAKEDGVVVDAQIVNYYIVNDLKGKASSEDVKLMNLILKSCGIVVDERIISEWENTNRNSNYRNWFVKYTLNGKIGYAKEEIKLSKEDKKKIHVKYGFPRGRSKDIHYIKCALNTRLKFLLTKDMDFYEPKKKKAESSERTSIMNGRNGELCKFLEDEFDIIVGLHCHCFDHLSKNGITE
jgi:hypothetical protein